MIDLTTTNATIPSLLPPMSTSTRGQRRRGGQPISRSTGVRRPHRKPVLYLLSHKPIRDVSVQVLLSPVWTFDVVYPIVPVIGKEAGGEAVVWNVNIRGKNDGLLREVGSGVEVSYLFWETLCVFL